MAAPSEQETKGIFECQLCGLTAPYTYVGQTLPTSHAVVLLEECYVLKDPFTSDQDKFLILGSWCSLCHKQVCVGQECSLFYARRFCLPCVRKNLSAFPQEIQQDVARKHVPSEPSSRNLDSLT